uniref:Uncharacterized protein n=1 Tax=Anguilla anguilla TaxID=7936 RepID=A0A0E9U3P4_ANGAN
MEASTFLPGSPLALCRTWSATTRNSLMGCAKL